jgi:integrase
MGTTKTPRKHRNMFQDATGRWWLDFRTSDGRRRRKLCGSYEDAKAKLADVETAKKRGTYVDENSAPTFELYAQYYLENVSSHKNSHGREKRLMKNLVTCFGGFRISKVKRTLVIEYRTLRLRTVKPATVNREISLLRHVFNVAIGHGLLAINPARGGPGLTAFKEERRMRFLEMEEIDRLLAAIQTRITKNSADKLKANAKKFWQYLHTIVVAALHTGMRKGEILGLRWQQINWNGRYILLTNTKNGEPRRVPVDAALLTELSDHRQRVPKSEFVFPSFDRCGLVAPLSDVKVAFARALNDAAISGFRFHDLRHTFASHYVMSKGANLYTLAKILGHKSIAMTQRYADLSPDFIDRERERMDSLWIPSRSAQSPLDTLRTVAPQLGKELDPDNARKYMQ